MRFGQRSSGLLRFFLGHFSVKKKTLSKRKIGCETMQTEQAARTMENIANEHNLFCFWFLLPRGGLRVIKRYAINCSASDTWGNERCTIQYTNGNVAAVYRSGHGHRALSGACSFAVRAASLGKARQWCADRVPPNHLSSICQERDLTSPYRP